MTLVKEEFIKEIILKTSRSGGKGGQNVNKVSSKVMLVFNLRDSKLFTADEKQYLFERLGHKLDTTGCLQFVSQEDRSQLVNREKVIEKAIMLLQKALLKPKKRKPTTVPKGSREERLDQKARKASIKETRKKFTDF